VVSCLVAHPERKKWQKKPNKIKMPDGLCSLWWSEFQSLMGPFNMDSFQNVICSCRFFFGARPKTLFGHDSFAQPYTMVHVNSAPKFLGSKIRTNTGTEAGCW